MASLSTVKAGPRAGCRRILFVDAAGRRQNVYLGRLPRPAAELVTARVGAIVACRGAGETLSPDLAKWVASLSDGFHAKLAKTGIVEPRAASTRRTVGDLIAAFTNRATVKASTRASYKQTCDSVAAFVGTATLLENVTAETADAWKAHISTATADAKKKRGTADNRLSPATVAKRVFVARAMFRRAARWGWIAKSPFDGVKAGTQANPERAFYVTPEATARILDACPSIEWRLVVALARYAGLRCPSEIIALRWDDVVWDAGRLVVRPPKTAGHAGHEVRVVPVCPELRDVLDEAYAVAAVGAVAVVPMVRDGGKNLRTTFHRIIRRAGLTPWPRLFQNLRASRATEWAETYPAHVVAAWLGHSPAVAARHYLQVRDHHFDDVVSGGADVARQGARAVAHQGAQHALAGNRTASRLSTEEAIESALTSQVVATGRLPETNRVGDIGLEPMTPSLSS
jgi:integrase